MPLKPIPPITAEQENFRFEPSPDPDMPPHVRVFRRDPVEPVPVGTYIVQVFQVVGYRRDCDGSLIPQFVGVDQHGERDPVGRPEAGCLAPDLALQVDHPSELWASATTPVRARRGAVRRPPGRT